MNQSRNDGGYGPRKARQPVSYKDFNTPIEGDAKDAATDFAWHELQYVPYDGGACDVHFETFTKSVPRLDADGNQAEHPRIGLLWDEAFDGWGGHRANGTEEGYERVAVRVYEREDRENPDEGSGVWIVEVSTESRDCDGRYTGGRTAIFEADKCPRWDDDEQWQRDHSAEAAGY